MTREETSQALTVLKAAYPDFYRNLTPKDALSMLEVWSAVFASEPLELVKYALFDLIKTHTGYPPRPGDVAQKILEITAAVTGEPTDEQYWHILRTAISNSSYEAAKEYANVKSPAQIENEIELHKSKMQEKEEHLNLLKIAAEALDQADAEQRRSFSHILDGKALAIFKDITNDKYDGLMISKDLEISVSGEQSFGTQKLSSLSRGANDQAYFALRLALAEQIGEQAGDLPILLDDVFSQYDDKRQNQAFAFLKKYSADNQILFFTCHNVCVDLAQKSDANIIKL